MLEHSIGIKPKPDGCTEPDRRRARPRTENRAGTKCIAKERESAAMSDSSSSDQSAEVVGFPATPRSARPNGAMEPRVLAVANQKGGVGKTTTAINLGTALAAIGEDVLIVDLDPQGNASTGLGIDRRNRKYSTYDVLAGEATLRDAIVQTAVPRLHLAPSTMDLSGLELELGSTPGRAFRLRDAIAALNTNATPD